MESIAAQVAQWLAAGEKGEAVRAIGALGREQARKTKEATLQALLDEAVTNALGPARGARKTELAPWACTNCGERRGDQLRRNGRYRRQLLTVEGIVQLHMPQLVCADCHRAWPLRIRSSPPVSGSGWTSTSASPASTSKAVATAPPGVSSNANVAAVSA